MMLDLSTMKELTVGGVKLSELSINGTKVWQSGPLPSGYTQLEYIETDGNQWIDTGVLASDYPDGIRYTFKGNITDFVATSGNNYAFGCLNDGKRSGNISFMTTRQETDIYIGSATYPAFAGDLPTAGEDFELVMSAVSTDPAGVLATINGTEFSRTNYSLSSSDMPSGNVYLLYCSGVGTSSKPFWGKCYSFTMDTADGTAIRNFIPCLRNADSALGMYDTVGGKFYENIGTGEFIAGAELAA